jgi:hypothetical protein
MEHGTLLLDQGNPYARASISSWRGPAANLLNWTEAVQVTKTNDRPDLSSEGAPDIDKTITVKQWLISGHEPQMGLHT